MGKVRSCETRLESQLADGDDYVNEPQKGTLGGSYVRIRSSMCTKFPSFRTAVLRVPQPRERGRFFQGQGFEPTARSAAVEDGQLNTDLNEERSIRTAGADLFLACARP